MGASSRIFAFSASTLCVALLASCNGLVGLDAFDKVDTLSDAGGRDGGGELILPEGTLPVTWATWRVVESLVSQTGIATDQQGFGSGGTGVAAVLDKTTNHIWLVETGFAANFAEARAYCETKPFGPWRLPSRIELASLLDFSKTDRIDPVLFPSHGREPTWTASAVRPIGNPVQFWAMTFRAGAVLISPLPANGGPIGSVRCIRGRAP